jgi:hypothetical protein
MGYQVDWSIGPNPGPTADGLWLEAVPDESMFSGTPDGTIGKNIFGFFWKDKRGVVELCPTGRFWNYWEYRGVWVNEYCKEQPHERNGSNLSRGTAG